ncbi:MAG: hypothetical protein JXB88_01630 [Spirochaetales bacterium]|nr:hypothetical protein [Spirochaetales bacterium]
MGVLKEYIDKSKEKCKEGSIKIKERATQLNELKRIDSNINNYYSMKGEDSSPLHNSWAANTVPGVITSASPLHPFINITKNHLIKYKDSFLEKVRKFFVPKQLRK